ncbi:hypothetical protein Tco_0212454 [Tanacetum coccineum]
MVRSSADLLRKAISNYRPSRVIWEEFTKGIQTFSHKASHNAVCKPRRKSNSSSFPYGRFFKAISVVPKGLAWISFLPQGRALLGGNDQGPPSIRIQHPTDAVVEGKGLLKEHKVNPAHPPLPPTGDDKLRSQTGFRSEIPCVSCWTKNPEQWMMHLRHSLPKVHDKPEVITANASSADQPERFIREILSAAWPRVYPESESEKRLRSYQNKNGKTGEEETRIQLTQSRPSSWAQPGLGQQREKIDSAASRRTGKRSSAKDGMKVQLSTCLELRNPEASSNLRNIYEPLALRRDTRSGSKRRYLTLPCRIRSYLCGIESERGYDISGGSMASLTRSQMRNSRVDQCQDFRLLGYNKGMESRKWSEDDNEKKQTTSSLQLEKRLQIEVLYQRLEALLEEE